MELTVKDFKVGCRIGLKDPLLQRQYGTGVVVTAEDFRKEMGYTPGVPSAVIARWGGGRDTQQPRLLLGNPRDLMLLQKMTIRGNELILEDQ